MSEDPVEFSATPKVVKPKKKFKEKELEEEQDEIKLIYNNLMWDKRVFRGNTYSALVTSKNVDIPQTNTLKKPTKILHPQNIEIEEDANRRANIQIFTDQFVETLTDKPPKYEYGGQTQFVMDKQICRHQLPDKQGENIQTQIWDNELFDFDYEAEPLLSVLIARTLQISRMEVMQESELAIMKNRQKQLHLLEDLENEKIKNMYNLQEQLQKQNAKVLSKYRQEQQKKIITFKKLFSKIIGKKYLQKFKENTYNKLQQQGFFRNQVQIDLINKMVPKFYQDCINDEKYLSQWKNQVDELKKVAMEGIILVQKKSKALEMKRRQKIYEKRAELAREKNERKLMKEEEIYMKNFLVEQKLYEEREEEEERRREEEGQNSYNV